MRFLNCRKQATFKLTSIFIFLSFLSGCSYSIKNDKSQALSSKLIAGDYPKKLNNFVKKIAHKKLSPGNSIAHFYNPREGWVIFSLKTSKEQDIEKAFLISNNSKKLIKFIKKESMQWLLKGRYQVEFLSDSNMSDFQLDIRLIPQIIYSRTTGHYNSPNKQAFIKSSKEEHGREGMNLYYWDFLEKNIFYNYNTIIAGGHSAAELEEWNNYGRKIIIPVGVTNNKAETEKLFNKWSNGFKAPYSGSIADEFVPPSKIISEKDKTLGGYNPGLGFNKKILNLINKIHEKYGNRGSFYAYLGIPSNTPLENCSPLMDRLLKNDYYWVWEAYIWPQKKASQVYLNKKLVKRMEKFRALFPGSEKNCIICLAPIISWDKESDLNFKVWLDMQMNLIANNNAFENISGISFWTSTYTDPEILRWFSMLMRYYCIEGNTDMLSNKYEYSLILNHILNSDFRAGLKEWDVYPAKPDSIFIKKTTDFSFKRGYFPYANKLLTIKKSAKENKFGQKINNLKKGRLYSLSYLCASPKVSASITYHQKIDLKNAQVIQKTVDIRRDICNNVCWNYVRVIFKPERASAYFMVSDGMGTSHKENPQINEMIYDSFKVQPFYAEQ